MRTLNEISEAVRLGERISAEDAVTLWREAPLWLLGELATERKRKASGDMVYYNRNIHIEPSNICLFNCEFCSFRRREGDADAWFMSVDEVVERARQMQGSPITEIHIVGGVHPAHTLDSYCEMIYRIKQILPNVAVKAYTAVEIFYMIRKAGVTVVEGLRRLQEAGMESIPGGGAEIFDEELRKQICPDKCSSDEWLAVHRAAHNMGIHTNCTMLYGHIESIEQRVDHLERLRKLQDCSPGFDAFIPLKYRSRNNRMSHLGECSVEEDLRTIAISRIFLDNIPHIKAYWVAYGKEVTEMALAFGADDIDGTIDDSTKIYSMAGGDEKPSMSVAELEALVRDAGFTPVERDTLYRVVEREEEPADNGNNGVAAAVVATAAATAAVVEEVAAESVEVAESVVEDIVPELEPEPESVAEPEVVEPEPEPELEPEVVEPEPEPEPESVAEPEMVEPEPEVKPAVERAAAATYIYEKMRETPESSEKVAPSVKDEKESMAKKRVAKSDKFKKSMKGLWQNVKAAYWRVPLLFHIGFIMIFLMLLALGLHIGLKKGTRHGEAIVVPNFVNLSLDEAEELAAQYDLRIVVRDEVVDDNMMPGTVIAQNPSLSDVRDVTVKPGRRIYLTIISGEKEDLPVPYVARQALDRAIFDLRSNGFTVKKLLYDSLHSPDNQVVAQLVNDREVYADTEVMMPRGSGVTLRVSYTIDKCDTLVPSLVGYSLMEAERRLWETGLNVGEVRYDNSVDLRDRRASRVFLQGVGPNKRVAYGTEVSLYLTDDTAVVDSMRTVVAKELKINALVRVARERILDVKRGIEMGIMNSRPADYYDSESAAEIIEIDDEDDFFLY